MSRTVSLALLLLLVSMAHTSAQWCNWAAGECSGSIGSGGLPNVAPEDWDNARATAVKSGDAAGGVLGGTFPNPTLGTDSVSATQLNAAGVEAELEAVLDLQDLQGAVTDAQVPDTVTIDHTSAGKYVTQTVTVASLPVSPTTNQILTVTDGVSASDCVTGGGAERVRCQYDGADWQPVGGGSTAEADTLSTVSARGSEYGGATAASPFKIYGPGAADDSARLGIWNTAGGDLKVQTIDPSDTGLTCRTNFNLYFNDEEAGTPGLTWDCDANGTGSGTMTWRDPFISDAYVDMEVCDGSPTTATVTVSGTCTSQGMFYNGDNDAIQFNLPAAASGKAFCFHAGTFAQVVTINPDDADTITLNGVAGSVGVSIVSSGAAGEFICLHGETDGNWQSWGFSGTWAVGS